VLADGINSARHVVYRIADALTDDAQPLRDSQIVVLGMTYKPDVADTRESPSPEVLALLLAKGADAVYHDPHVPAVELDGWRLESVALDERTLGEADCVVVATDHRGYDWGWIAERSRLLVDARNLTKGVRNREARIASL
jgi:UDP-N-acetyl-D-glucosamine dehydrogenase